MLKWDSPVRCWRRYTGAKRRQQVLTISPHWWMRLATHYRVCAPFPWCRGPPSTGMARPPAPPLSLLN
jgi:hypothetical protein